VIPVQYPDKKQYNAGESSRKTEVSPSEAKDISPQEWQIWQN